MRRPRSTGETTRCIRTRAADTKSRWHEVRRSRPRPVRLPPRRRAACSSTCRCAIAIDGSRCGRKASSPMPTAVSTCRSICSRRSAAPRPARIPRVPLPRREQPAARRRVPVGSVVGARRRAVRRRRDGCALTTGSVARRHGGLLRRRLPLPQQPRVRRPARPGIQPRRLHSPPEVRTCLLSLSPPPRSPLAGRTLRRRPPRRRCRKPARTPDAVLSRRSAVARRRHAHDSASRRSTTCRRATSSSPTPSARPRGRSGPRST